MSDFVVWDGAIHQAFDTLDEATALVARHPGARVIGDEWLIVGRAKERVDQARRAIDEAWGGLGLGGRLAPVPARRASAE
jgi:hypothetical protein